jgi:hypothetical protein
MVTTFDSIMEGFVRSCIKNNKDNVGYCKTTHLISRLTPGVLLPPDHRHEFKILIPITLLDMTTIVSTEDGGPGGSMS